MMKTPIWAAAVSLAVVASVVAQTSAAPASGQRDLAISRHGSQASVKGPAANFTGTVRVDPLFQPNTLARTAGAYVTFEPGARSAWHSHPLGQTLVVTAGVGRVQRWGGAVQEIRPGDVVWTPPGVKHWHGASPTNAMTHLAIQETVEGKTVEWMEKVSDSHGGQPQLSVPAKTPPNSVLLDSFQLRASLIVVDFAVWNF